MFTGKAEAYCFTVGGVPAFDLEKYDLISLKDFDLHSYDKSIREMLGYDSGKVTYFSEMASLNENERDLRSTYEKLGCYPFYFTKDGKTEEAGFNCRTFYCTGYLAENMQCRDSQGKPYTAGALRIDNKNIGLSLATCLESLPQRVVTSEMQSKLAKLKEVKCDPYYLLVDDVLIVGEGYECSEFGQYPYFAPVAKCEDSWEDNIPSSCADLPEKDYQQRLTALYRGDVPSSSRSSVSLSDLFIDISSSYPYFDAITWGKESGILKGYADGSFRPDQAVNRAEFLKIVLEASDASLDASQEPKGFPDTPNDTWYAAYVRYAKAHGIIQGYSDGTFRPEKAVNFAEALKMAYNTLGVATEPSDGTWYSRYLNHAKGNGVLYNNAADMGSDMTRKDVVWIVWKLLGLR